MHISWSTSLQTIPTLRLLGYMTRWRQSKLEPLPFHARVEIVIGNVCAAGVVAVFGLFYLFAIHVNDSIAAMP